jgi:cytochrome c oxidase subunit 2
MGIAVAIALVGCTQSELQGFLPGNPDVTNHTSRIMGLWTTSWVVLLVVGLVTWGLILWAAIAYRRRRGQTGVPVQMRYNLPIEVLYTVIPFILVIGFFAFTARDQAAIEEPIADPDVKIQAIGKQWSFDFNYVEEDVYTAGIQAQIKPDGQIDGQNVPTLVLPVGKTVEIQLDSRDVVHSFWVIDFLYKKDMIPGKTNYMYFVPQQEGEFLGKCAELCGEYHSQMLFKVRVVSVAEYESYIQQLRDAGNVGQLGNDMNRNQNLLPEYEIQEG